MTDKEAQPQKESAFGTITRVQKEIAHLIWLIERGHIERGETQSTQYLTGLRRGLQMAERLIADEDDKRF